MKYLPLVIVLSLTSFTACRASNNTSINKQNTISNAKKLILKKRFYPHLSLIDINHIDTASKKFNVPHSVLSTILHLESSGGLNTASRQEPHLNTSSIGQFQVLKTTARYIGIPPILLHKPRYNALAAAKYLKLMYTSKVCGAKSWACGIKRYNGSGKKAEAYLSKAKRYFKINFNRRLK